MRNFRAAARYITRRCKLRDRSQKTPAEGGTKCFRGWVLNKQNNSSLDDGISWVEAGGAVVRRLGSTLAACCALAMLPGCATLGGASKEIPPLEQLMGTGGSAQQKGDKPNALSLFQEAAKQYPASKEPWLRMAQMHFDGNAYGSAIVAAEEVLQRDPADLTAKNILAIAGARVAARGVADVKQANALSGATRTEAEKLAQSLRDALGEPPRVEVEPPPPPPVRRRAAVRPVPAVPGTAVAPPTTIASPPARSATAAPAASSPGTPSGKNPFESLK
jgi:hypothetical protein